MKKKLIVRITVITIVLVLVLFTFVSNIKVNSEEIKGSGIFSFKVNINNIDSIKIIEHDLNIGMKIFGAGLGNTFKGVFNTSEYGKSTLYINKKSLDYYIYIKDNDEKTYIINENSIEKTKNVYNKIYDYMNNLEDYKND